MQERSDTKRIEGSPFITRFKTTDISLNLYTPLFSIEGSPFITRFKTKKISNR